MRFNRFDLNLLVVLDALLSEQNITRAGKRLHLSQSATSGALARLREAFEDELLVQVGRRMVLTPLAESLVSPVRTLLLQAQATIEKRPEFDPAKSRRKFTFIMSDYTANVLLPEVTRIAARIAPSVMFEEVAPTNAPIEELDQGHADFLLLPSNFLSPDHPYCDVLTDHFVCVGCSDNPALQQAMTRDDYESMGHVIVSFGSERRPSVDVWLTEKAGIERRAEVVVNTFSAVPHYLIGTRRIATMHRRLALRWQDSLPVSIMDAPLDIPEINWGLQWHQFRNSDPATLWMRDLIVNTAKKLRS